MHTYTCFGASLSFSIAQPLVRPCQQAGLQCGIDAPDGKSLECNQTQPPRFPPVPDATAANAALWRGLIRAQKLGLVKSIGVSNFNKYEIEALPDVVPAVNQIEMSLIGWNKTTVDFCRGKGIAVETFGTFRGCPFGDKTTLGPIASTHNKSVGQVCLRWAIQRSGIAAAGTGSDPNKAPSYSRENLDVFGFALSEVELQRLDNFQNR